MDNNEKIDILIATYNGEKYIKEQLDSILNQTYTNINVIISDDMSVDSTYEILKEYEKKDTRVKVYRQSNNLGSNRNFEFLLTKVTSNYYMFSDQDDVWMQDKVEKTYNKIKQDNAGLVCTDLLLVDENLNSLNSTFNKKLKKERKLKKYNNWKMVFLYNVVTGCTIMSKKEYIKDILPIPDNKNVLHDHFISLVVGNKSIISYLDEPTIKYRQHAKNQVGTKKYTDRFKNFNDTRDYLINLKLSIFNTYLDRKSIFCDEFIKLSNEAVDFFESAKNIKYFSLKNIRKFNNIYKTETFFYKFWNLCIFNFPLFAKIWYKLFK